MAAGIPVIGSSIAVEGLESQIKKSMIVEDNFDKYALIIKELYKNELIVDNLSVNGRKFIVNFRDWKKCITDVIKAYQYSLDI